MRQSVPFNVGNASKVLVPIVLFKFQRLACPHFYHRNKKEKYPTLILFYKFGIISDVAFIVINY